MSSARSDFTHKGFTLIELLVVIAIIAILAVVVVLTLNPGQLILQSRDSTRLSDLASLQSAVALYQTDRAINGTVSLGSSSIVYVSLPDPAATSSVGTTCSTMGLPALPNGYTYHCAASSTFRKVDGTGWIPVNLSSISSGAPLGQLPIDPVNSSSTRSYLTYTTNGTQYEVTSQIESSKYKLGGANDVASLDGGTQTTLYEKGTNLTLQPMDYGDTSLVGYWTFDEGSGSVAYDYSGNNATGSWQGTLGSQWSTNARVGSYAGSFNGTDNYVRLSPISIPRFSVVAWVQLNGNASGTPAIISDKYPSYVNYTIAISPGTTNVYGGTYNGGWYQTTPSALATSSWQLVTLTFDGSNLSFYKNTSIQSAVSVPIVPQSSGSELRIGERWDLPDFFSGKVDDVRIYNRALSAAEIQALYNSQR